MKRRIEKYSTNYSLHFFGLHHHLKRARPRDKTSIRYILHFFVNVLLVSDCALELVLLVNGIDLVVLSFNSGGRVQYDFVVGGAFFVVFTW